MIGFFAKLFLGKDICDLVSDLRCADSLIKSLQTDNAGLKSQNASLVQEVIELSQAVDEASSEKKSASVDVLGARCEILRNIMNEHREILLGDISVVELGLERFECPYLVYGLKDKVTDFFSKASQQLTRIEQGVDGDLS